VTGVEYSNVVKPGQVPMGGMGAIPVIARLVCTDGTEEWWPAKAVRWTEDAVLVGYESLLPAIRTAFVIFGSVSTTSRE
jgi:hypothetical protein